MGETVTFKFGENWLDFLSTVDDAVRLTAVSDLERWLGAGNIAGRTVIDIGSGSGLSSFAFRQAGCSRLVSIDVDPQSVEATSKLASNHPELCDGWSISEGSILDDDLVGGLGAFDIVYSWGVLHHTGSMWKAIGNAIRLVGDDGFFWISIYQGGPRYDADLALKRRYNAADEATREQMIQEAVAAHKALAVMQGLDPDDWNRRNERGMNRYHDIIDWLGGLPYEVARPGEIVGYCMARGLTPLRVLEAPEGGCSIYLFRRSGECGPDSSFAWAKEGGRAVSRTLREIQSDDLRRADRLYLDTKRELEERIAAAERRAAEAEGRLNSGTHLVRALARRIGSGILRRR